MTEPLLNAPPGFVLLGVMVGLAAYLRQLGENRSKQIDEIEEGEVWNFPLSELHTKEKLSHLKESHDRLNQIAPLAIWYTIAISVRLLLLAYVRYVFPDDALHYERFFRFADLLITATLGAFVIALYYMHSVTKRKEDRVRAMMEVWKHKRGQQLMKDRSEGTRSDPSSGRP